MTTKAEYIQHRLQKAWETFQDAEMLAANERWNSAANRLYYACFQAVSALHTFANLPPTKTHKGLKISFQQHFIKSSTFPAEMGILFTKLHNLRESSDYDAFEEAEREDILPLVGKVQKFLETIQKYMAG